MSVFRTYIKKVHSEKGFGSYRLVEVTPASDQSLFKQVEPGIN